MECSSRPGILSTRDHVPLGQGKVASLQRLRRCSENLSPMSISSRHLFADAGLPLPTGS